MAERRFKYMKDDFLRFPVTIKHMDIYLNFLGNDVHTLNSMALKANENIDTIRLNADSLVLDSLTQYDDYSFKNISEEQPQFTYDRKSKIITIRLNAPVAEGQEVYIRTSTVCTPSDNILEGIYRDITPKGAPQQFISQCQQWGFQRIMPVIDDCRAKCTMHTTIEADANYTHLISNGNINTETNPDLIPVKKEDSPERIVMSYKNDIPMAPYLFVVAVGTWDVLKSEVSYSDGKVIGLEYLVPPGKANDAKVPMEILKESVLWIKDTQGYTYARDFYRTICMTKSDFGGMENVGNTTIVTDAALIDEHTMDSSLLYAHKVIVHEFEHNQCGSETTMETPFDMWLNEGYTVDVERQYMSDKFDHASVRIGQISSLRTPLLGPLALEDSGVTGRISRLGFNHPDEIVDGVTYEKSAEVIRMLRLIMTPEKFREAKTLYFQRYKDSNASTDQFFACFEEVYGESLEQFKQGWINTQGYPTVTATAEHIKDESVYEITFTQENSGNDQRPFHIPIELALAGKDGKDIEGTGRIYELKDKKATARISEIEEEPLFASLNRDCSFYGRFMHKNIKKEQLISQAMLDSNIFNRVEAMRVLTDMQRIAILNDIDAQIDEDWLSMYGKVLDGSDDSGISNAVKASMLTIGEQSLERKYATWYREMVAAKDRMMLAVNQRYNREIKEAFSSLDTYSEPKSLQQGIEDRSLKVSLLALIAVEDSEESHKMMVDHYRKATTANDRVTALLFLNRSSSQERIALLEEAYSEWKDHLSGYANYLRVISSGTNDDVFLQIEIEKEKEGYDAKLPTHSRALIMPMAFNTKMVWSDVGLEWAKDTIIEFSKVNTTLASRLLNLFQHVDGLRIDLKSEVTRHLEDIESHVTEEDNATVHNQAKSYLDKVR